MEYRKKGKCGSVDNFLKLKNGFSLERMKYPLLVLALGIILMLIPGNNNSEGYETATDPTLAELLSNSKGVGECKVLISDNGALIVCEGAENAGVRLEIIHAVGSYTGYSSDKITILKMKNQA